MNPISVNELISIYCGRTGKDPKKVKKVLESYWKTIKKDITSLQYYSYTIEGIGTWEVRQNRIESKIKILEVILDVTPPTSFKNMEVYYYNDQLKAKLYNLLDIIKQESERKKSIKQAKWKKDLDPGESLKE